MRRITLLFSLALLLLIPSPAKAQTTQFVGVFRDSGNNLVTTGEIEFDLQPSIDTTINGYARFTPVANICFIKAMAQGLYTLTRTSNTVTLVHVGTDVPFTTGDTVWVTGASDSTFNGAFTVATNDGNGTVTWAQTAANSTATGASFSALRPAIAPGPCVLIQNSAVVPAGTSYKVLVMPNFALTSVFTVFAVGAGPIDLSTVVPTPATMPVYSIPTLVNSQTWTGTNTFSGPVNLLGGGSIGGTWSGTPVWSGLPLFSAGISLPFGNIITGVAGPFINFNHGIAVNGNLFVLSGGGVVAATFGSTTANIAASGVVKLAHADTINWRNNANSGDLSLGVNGSDNMSFGALPVTQTIGSGTTTTNGTLIAAGVSQAQPTITVTGATATDVAHCSLNAALPATWQTGINWNNPVVTSNTVTLWLMNGTAGGITPAATTVRCTVTR